MNVGVSVGSIGVAMAQNAQKADVMMTTHLLAGRRS